MILVREVFHLKWNKTQQVLGQWKAMLQGPPDENGPQHARMMTDLTGRFYTVVMETTFPSIQAHQEWMQAMFANMGDGAQSDGAQSDGAQSDSGQMNNADDDLIDSGHREYYTIEFETSR